jgi:hypothetical protein
MSRRRCRKAHKAAMLRIWYVEQSLKQRPELAGRPGGRAPKAGWNTNAGCASAIEGEKP